MLPIRRWLEELVIGKRLMDINLDDVITLKKIHPCGSYDWKVIRTGMDIRLSCLGCGRQVLLPRKQVEKNIKKLVKASDA